MSRSLVLGLSGQVGEALAPMLAGIGPVLALSRTPQPPIAGVEWRQGVLQDLDAAPEGCERIISLGPLDLLAGWLQGTRPAVARIVAIGSMGLHDKRESPDAFERGLAARLACAEELLFEHGRASGAAVTVLRPSLLYGNGRDRSLTPLAAQARRWRCLPWPRGATGLRQPVHVEDVARAVRDCLDAEASHARAFDLPGGERLRLDAMVARYLQRHAPQARLLRLPDAIFAAGARIAGRGDSLRGWLWRARRDQIGDFSPAADAFGFAPREFTP